MDTIYLFFTINYFAQGMSGLAYEPVEYLLKDNLHLSAGQSALFVTWMTIPFLIKPLFGILTDAIPIRGLRRLPHLAIFSVLAAGSWLLLATRSRFDYASLMILLLMVNIGVVTADVICDAVMVEQGKANGKTGIYQSAQIATLYFTLVLTGIGGGWLTAHVAYRRIFALASIFPLMILGSGIWIRESPARDARRQSFRELMMLLADKRFWALSAFIFLWSFYPFLGTAQFYYQSNVLKFDPVYIGFLSTLGGIAGALGALFYGRVVGRVWSTANLIRASVVIGGPLSLLYVFYLGPISVALVTVIIGFFGVAFRLALMDLAAQSCPSYGEATAFAAYMAVFNLAASASNAVGGRLYDSLQLFFSLWPQPAYLTLVCLSLIGSACTFSCWLLLPHLVPQLNNSIIKPEGAET